MSRVFVCKTSLATPQTLTPKCPRSRIQALMCTKDVFELNACNQTLLCEERPYLKPSSALFKEVH